MGVRAPLALKSLVSVPRLAIKSLISEATVCFVFSGEHRKKEPAAAGRLHCRSRCLGTLRGRGDPAESPASHRVFRKGDCMGKLRTLGGSWDLQDLSLKCAHIYLSRLLNRWCQNYNL